MCIAMVAIPEGAGAGLFGEVTKAIGNELDGGGGVGDEDEVEVARVGAEEAECLLADGVNHVTGQLGGLVGGMGVAVEVGAHLVSEALDGRLGVDGRAAVVEVDA